MALEVNRVDVWAGPIPDKPGGVAKALQTLADAGANLEFVVGRRVEGKGNKAVLFVCPLKGAAQIKAAKSIRMKKAVSMASLRIAGPDRAGIGACLMGMIAEAGINCRGISAARIGRKFVQYLAFDSPADSTKAARILRKC